MQAPIESERPMNRQGRGDNLADGRVKNRRRFPKNFGNSGVAAI
jgi:hypothetical protein